MKSYRKELWFEIPSRRAFVNITPDVEACLRDSGIEEGLALAGREVVVAITGGKLDFGPWERIFYGEFDGGRRKRVVVKIIGSG